MSFQIDSVDDENDWGDHRNFAEGARGGDDTQLLSSSLRKESRNEPASLSSSARSIYFEMPPQLHPACSAGVRRVSSCYFSLSSFTDHQSVTGVVSQTAENCLKSDVKNVIDENEHESMIASVDFFYHDILMQIFTFLDPKSLLFFSETARRPNFEVFYFLQLQLQQALLLDDDDDANCVVENYNVSTFDSHASILSRVARLNMEKARELLEEYQDSNSTLRTMPLSYSLAYVQHYLSHKAFHKMFSSNSKNSSSRNVRSSKMSSSQTLASAAIFVTAVGAASLVSSSDTPMNLLSVGFVGILGAISDPNSGSVVREKAEQMARSIQELPAALIAKRRNLEQAEIEERIDDGMNFVLPSLYEMRDMLQEILSRSTFITKNGKRQPLLFDPGGHFPSQRKSNDEKRETDSEEGERGRNDDDGKEHLTKLKTTAPTDGDEDLCSGHHMPSGCVGAFSRAIHKAADFVTSEIKSVRKASFESLPSEEQRLRSLEFLSVCSSNDALNRVKEMIFLMDVNRFYIGNDGTETCALHTAAFNGADKVVEFLCAGINLKDSRLDGGLCDVNAKDNNGWTALHFAAGANSVATVRVLARHGAALNVEAQNGYSPLSWAIRLSNDGVTEELKMLIHQSATEQSGTWMSTEPLASIANHFLSFIPLEKT
mmetsp:Transcript_22271/g.52943  ORF Transcript_22271/g.52943 Transcript_22271/m.52943 type:complete len:658 (+) Transcript_22271:196-2169(+)|eukprot:CAMPEP_0197173054 /NCGR_PEP_ID=MMETSP1423-20130617/112_1 /TAXON_ID=476441 /ORGANISM="Pseudo-nitzschia heimii, Strain UNC1101" /LENGTH=657 /DNA_ID=CAMNT_0042621805 /DNA_START=172 /DNA_END=2145 /DNA_ORIENTATION=-